MAEARWRTCSRTSAKPVSTTLLGECRHACQLAGAGSPYPHAPATRQCKLRAAPRVYTTVKIITRTDKDQTLEDKVASVQALL